MRWSWTGGGVLTGDMSCLPWLAQLEVLSSTTTTSRGAGVRQGIAEIADGYPAIEDAT